MKSRAVCSVPRTAFRDRIMSRDGEGYEYDDDDRFAYMDETYGDEDDFDCGLASNGQCAMAGSEDCDWDCPHSHGPRFAGSRAWLKEHNAGAPIDGCECIECRGLRAGK
jgi:hypothetical protein